MLPRALLIFKCVDEAKSNHYFPIKTLFFNYFKFTKYYYMYVLY